MQKIVEVVLIKNGWKSFGGSAIAVKEFQTAVGMKEAQAYLSDGDGINRTLSGAYETAGHDALANCSVLIPVDASEQTVSILTSKFCQYAEDAIEQSYAVNVLRSQSSQRAG